MKKLRLFLAGGREKFGLFNFSEDENPTLGSSNYETEL